MRINPFTLRSKYWCSQGQIHNFKVTHDIILPVDFQRVHTANANSDEPKYTCEECPCVFRRLGSLNAHISRNHATVSYYMMSKDGNMTKVIHIFMNCLVKF